MSQDNHEICVHCGCHEKCDYCSAEYVPGTKAPLSKTTGEGGGTIHREALHRDSHKQEAPHKTHQTSINRASSSPHGCTASHQTPLEEFTFTNETSAIIPEPAALTDTTQDRIFEGDDRTPRTPPYGFVDPLELVPAIEGTSGTHPTGLPRRLEQPSNVEAPLTSQSNSGLDPLHDFEWHADIPLSGDDSIWALGSSLNLENAGALNYDDLGSLEFDDLGASFNYDSSIVEPHRIPVPAVPSVATGIDAVNGAHTPSNFQLSPTVWTDNITNGPISNIHLPLSCQISNQSEAFSSSTPLSSDHKIDDHQQFFKRRKSSGEYQEGRYADRNVGSCDLCIVPGNNGNKPFACHFYKRNPGLHFGCSQKSFKNMSHLRQHLDNDHKLGPHYCGACWESFNDPGSMKQHTNCNPTGGIPVDQLPKVSKARKDPEHKWIWIWKQLFGDTVPPPQCPYAHFERDMRTQNLSQFLEVLPQDGSKLSFFEIKEAMLQWHASNPKPSNNFDRLYSSSVVKQFPK